MRSTHCLLLATLLGWGGAANALCLDENHTLPEVALSPTSNSGQIVYHHHQDKLEYLPWSSRSLGGRTFVLYHLAARRGADALNEPFMAALEQLPAESYQLVVMLNIDDVFTGGSYIARQTFEANAKKSAHEVVFVLDNESTVRDRWCIRPKSSTVILVNAEGRIIKAKDGALTTEEIQEFLQRVRQLHALPEQAGPPGLPRPKT